MSAQLAERLNAFTYHAPSKSVQNLMQGLRLSMMNMATLLDEDIPECREKALAFIALEESAMWAMKALSHTDPEGKVISP